MTRPAYKKLYEQEKARRELYERLCPEVVAAYDTFRGNCEQLRSDYEQSVLMGKLDEVEKRAMVGIKQFITGGGI